MFLRLSYEVKRWSYSIFHSFRIAPRISLTQNFLPFCTFTLHFTPSKWRCTASNSEIFLTHTHTHPQRRVCHALAVLYSIPPSWGQTEMVNWSTGVGVFAVVSVCTVWFVIFFLNDFKNYLQISWNTNTCILLVFDCSFRLCLDFDYSLIFHTFYAPLIYIFIAKPLA